MTAFPSQLPNTDNLDEGTDKIYLAQADLLLAVQLLTQIIESFGDEGGICELDNDGLVPATRILKGQAEGVCELSETGQIPALRIPLGDGLIIDSVTGKIKIKAAGTGEVTNIELAGNAFFNKISYNEFGQIISIGSGTSQSIQSSAFTSWYQTSAEASAAIPSNGTQLSIETRQVQSGTMQECRQVNIGKGATSTVCEQVPRYITQYRAAYLIQA